MPARRASRVPDFDGAVAVITGAASGLGRGLGLALASRGALILAADLDEGGLAKTVEEIRAAGGTCLTQKTDVRDVGSVQALADRAWGEFGTVNVVCNNAGVFAGGLTWESTDDDWEWVLGVNLRGVINGVRSFVPRMLAEGTEGHILNTASLAGIVSSPLSGVYSTSKFAVVGFTESLWHDLSLQEGCRIGVSVVCPAGVDTAIARSERSRPAELGDRTTGTEVDMVGAALSEMATAAKDPRAAAEWILEEVAEGKFYVSTSEAYAGHVAIAAEDLITQRPPTFQMFE